MQFLYSDEIKTLFRNRGWVWSSGSLYFNGNNTAAHPHLHIMIDGQRTVRRGDNEISAGDMRSAVTMIAYSDGGQGHGGGGRTFMQLQNAPAPGPRPAGAPPAPAAAPVLPGGPNMQHATRSVGFMYASGGAGTQYEARTAFIMDPRMLNELEWLMSYFLPD